MVSHRYHWLPQRKLPLDLFLLNQNFSLFSISTMLQHVSGLKFTTVQSLKLRPTVFLVQFKSNKPETAKVIAQFKVHSNEIKSYCGKYIETSQSSPLLENFFSPWRGLTVLEMSKTHSLICKMFVFFEIKNISRSEESTL